MLNKMLINGELVSGEGTAIDVFNPCNARFFRIVFR